MPSGSFSESHSKAVGFDMVATGAAAQQATTAKQKSTATVAPTYRIKWLTLYLLRCIKLPIPIRSTGSATSVMAESFAGSLVSRTNLLNRLSLLLPSCDARSGRAVGSPNRRIYKVRKSVRTTIHRNAVLRTDTDQTFILANTIDPQTRCKTRPELISKRTIRRLRNSR